MLEMQLGETIQVRSVLIFMIMVGTILEILAHGDLACTIIMVDLDITILGDMEDGAGLTDGDVMVMLTDGVDLDTLIMVGTTMVIMDPITTDGAMATDLTIITEVEAMP